MWGNNMCKQEHEREQEMGEQWLETTDARRGNNNKQVSLSHFPPSIQGKQLNQTQRTWD